MPNRLDYVALQVLIGGVDYTAKVTRYEVDEGVDIKIPTCTVEFTDLPSDVTYNQSLVISAGVLSLGADTTGLVTRFNGYVYDLNADLWPSVPKVEGRGQLILADLLLCPDDNQNQHQTDPLARPDDYKNDAPGIDMSQNPDTGADWSDADMVTWLLGQAGLAGSIDPDVGIQGTGKTLGTIKPEAFTWKRRTSALAFAESLDEMGVGYKTFERRGLIARMPMSPRTPFLDNRVTFLEGTDPLDSKLSRSAKDCKNRVVIQGADLGVGPVTTVLVGSCDALPPLSNPLMSYEPSPNEMIEQELPGDGPGLSTAEVATWQYDQWRHVMVQVQFSTWRDDDIHPGDTVYCQFPHNDNLNQSLWVTHVKVTGEGDPCSFTQTITALSVAQRDRAGNLIGVADAFAGGDSLPATMG